MSQDSAFAGSIPALYEECLVPVLFAPYAADLVARAVELKPGRVLEIAAGTVAVSHALAKALPGADILATDLNPAMLQEADQRGRSPNLTFKPADALALPYGNASFDLVLAQFGAMFFPDRVGAYREARRVLRAGGVWMFNVWDSLAANRGSAAVHEAVRASVPEPKPGFLARTPFGYSDVAQIEAEVRAAGFSEVAIERVGRTSPRGSAARLARGMCLGSPLANELAVHPPELRAAALRAAEEAAAQAEALGPLVMWALVVTAR
jgi:ubiquinone/menaquinone biosynthesis C-methylase UbiE